MENKMWDRFRKKGYSPTTYSKAHSISSEILYKVLNGEYDGSKKSKTGQTRKIIMHLKQDGVYIGKVAWEK